MNPAACKTFAELVLRGVELAIDGDRLRYRPLRVVDESLRAELARHKAELVTLLQCLATPPLRQGTWGSCASALLARINDVETRSSLREYFEERAGIAEYDGGLNTDEAERMAFVQLCQLARQRVTASQPQAAPEGGTR